ncbi:NADPH:quinone oxidoreductase family protein [Fodinicola feengrottensis]
MRAWQVQELGEPAKVLKLVEVDDPTPAAGQLLVKPLAAAVNFPDALMCRGLYQVKPPLPFTIGQEMCGEVLEVGEGVTGFKPGDRVLGGAPGAFADLTLTGAIAAFPAPASLTDAEASALFIGYQTGWFALHRRANLQPGETLLVHAAAGGVGSAAVQLGKAAGARVIGVVGGEAKADFARQLGADLVIDRKKEDVIAAVKAATDGKGVDVVYDPVGGDAYQQSTKVIAFEGRILVIGFASGTIPTPGINHALIKNYSIVGLHWGLYTQRAPQLVAECHAELTKLADAGAIKPLITEQIPFTEVPDAVQRLADGKTVGRLAVVPA